MHALLKAHSRLGGCFENTLFDCSHIIISDNIQLPILECAGYGT